MFSCRPSNDLNLEITWLENGVLDRCTRSINVLHDCLSFLLPKKFPIERYFSRLTSILESISSTDWLSFFF